MGLRLSAGVRGWLWGAPRLTRLLTLVPHPSALFRVHPRKERFDDSSPPFSPSL